MYEGIAIMLLKPTNQVLLPTRSSFCVELRSTEHRNGTTLRTSKCAFVGHSQQVFLSGSRQDSELKFVETFYERNLFVSGRYFNGRHVRL